MTSKTRSVLITGTCHSRRDCQHFSCDILQLMRYQSEKLERSYTDYTAYLSQIKSGKQQRLKIQEATYTPPLSTCHSDINLGNGSSSKTVNRSRRLQTSDNDIIDDTTDSLPKYWDHGPYSRPPFLSHEMLSLILLLLLLLCTVITMIIFLYAT